MGLSKNIELDSGLIVQNAYVRIDSRNGGNKTTLTITINYYVSRDFFKAGKAYVKQEMYEFEPSVADNSPNDIKQGYEYLKTLPEFAGAVDILEV